MHYRLYVTFNKEHAKDSQGARQYAYDTLMSDNSFVGEGGYFSSPVSDWFVIGGRWSGDLTNEKIEVDFEPIVGKILKKKERDWGFSSEEVKNNRDKIQTAWVKIGGVGENPYTRDTYNHFGYEDDAQIVTPTLYEKCLREYEGEDQGGDPNFVDLDYDQCSPDFIEEKWLCVVDYHN